jgi:hypothetical protein
MSLTRHLWSNMTHPSSEGKRDEHQAVNFNREAEARHSRRLRCVNNNRPPKSNVKALVAEPGSISGTASGRAYVRLLRASITSRKPTPWQREHTLLTKSVRSWTPIVHPAKQGKERENDTWIASETRGVAGLCQ